jgi:hypothetical protein
MLISALYAGVPARWVAGDEVYGADPALRTELELRRVGYVLAIGCDRRVPTAAGPIRADELAAGLPRRAWQRLSAGAGAKGQRYYDWAWVTLTPSAALPPDEMDMACWWLLVRRHRDTVSWRSTAATHPTSFRCVNWSALPDVAGPSRNLPGRQGPDRPRRASGPQLDLLAALDPARDDRARPPRSDRRRRARPAAHTHRAHRVDLQRGPRLFTIYVIAPRRSAACPEAWSNWRRPHQHRARTSHYQRPECLVMYAGPSARV